MTNFANKSRILDAINNVMNGLEHFDVVAELCSKLGSDEMKGRQSGARETLSALRQGLLEGSYDLTLDEALAELSKAPYADEDLDAEDTDEEPVEFEIFCLIDEARSCFATKTFATRQAALDAMPQVLERSGLYSEDYEIRPVD